MIIKKKKKKKIEGPKLKLHQISRTRSIIYPQNYLFDYINFISKSVVSNINLNKVTILYIVDEFHVYTNNSVFINL